MRVLTIILVFFTVLMCLNVFISETSANLVDKSFSRDVTSIVVDANLSTYVDSRDLRSALKEANASKLLELAKLDTEFPFSQEDIQSEAVRKLNTFSKEMRGIQASVADPKVFQNYIEGRDIDKIYVLIEAEFFPAKSIEPNLNHDVIVVSLKKKRALMVNEGGNIGMTKRSRIISSGPFLFSMGSDVNKAEKEFQEFINRHIVETVVLPIVE